MKSKKFNSLEEAIAYCNKAGKLKLYGRAGVDHQYAVYTLVVGNLVYHCNIHDDGRLDVVHERYKMEHD